MTLTQHQVVEAADRAARVLAAYEHTDPHKALIELLSALEQCHLHALADVSSEELPRVQGALRQIRQLQLAARGAGTARI